MAGWQSRGTVRLEGTRQLRRTLRAAGDDLTDMKSAHKSAAEIAAHASRSLAPKRSGKLAGTIRAAGTKTAAIVRAGYKRIPYGGPIHWGWFGRPNPAKGWRGGPIKPQPFLSRGAQDSEGRWIREYEEYLDKTLDKIKGI